MPIREIDCRCGATIEPFVSISTDIQRDDETCESCGRVVFFSSQEQDGITEVLEFKREVGDVGDEI